jgi:HAE1 family hydrophobic/amphiphilic exporter-1
LSLSLTSIRRPITITVIFIAVALLGIFSFFNLGIDLLPNVNIPHLIVQTTYTNASPEEVEKQITELLESAVATVTGVKKVTSVSKEGVSVISVDFVSERAAVKNKIGFSDTVKVINFLEKYKNNNKNGE